MQTYDYESRVMKFCEISGAPPPRHQSPSASGPGVRGSAERGGEVLQQGGFTDTLPAICVHVWVWVGGSCIHSIVDDCMEGEPTGGENWTLLDKSPQAHPLGGTTNNICNKEIALLIKLRTIENIATGEATRAIASLHFFDYFNFFVSNSVYNTHNTHGFYSV